MLSSTLLLSDGEMVQRAAFLAWLSHTFLCKLRLSAGIVPSPQILLLDLSTGSMLWSQPLPSLPGGPPSTSLMTADHRSAFFFWGLHELVGTNEMV